MSRYEPVERMVPSCPSTPERVAAFCRQRWSVELDSEGAALGRRHRAIVELRQAGDAALADTVGWITLAGLLTGCPSRITRALLDHPEPSAVVDEIAVQLGLDFPQRPRAPEVITNFACSITPVGDTHAWALCDLVGAACDPQDPVRIVNGLPVPAALVVEGYRRAIRTAVAGARS